MKRKIIRLGNQANILTLPIAWARENGLKPGDEVDLIVTEQNLMIYPQKHQQKKRTITLELRNDDFHLFRAELIEAYTLGYDTLIVNSPVKNAKKYLEEITSHFFIGFELVKHKNAVYELENISEPEEQKFDTIFRKMFQLCLEVFRNLVEGNDGQVQDKLEKMEKYNNFCKRCITKRIFSVEKEAIPHLWLLLSYLTKFKIAFAAFIADMGKGKLEKEDVKILKSLQDELSQLHHSFYTYDIELATRVYEGNKKLLHQKIYALKPKDRKGMMAYSHIFEFQRLVSYMTAPIIALSLHRKNLQTKKD